MKGNEWKVSKMPLSSINLVVYGKTQGCTDIALRSLEESMDSDFKEKVVEDFVVRNLTKDQVGLAFHTLLAGHQHQGHYVLPISVCPYASVCTTFGCRSVA